MHIHTCLSPCADISMSPGNIINEAIKKGLHIIGICDHNSAENVPAVLKCGETKGIKVIGGMEITTSEEVHILAFFGSLTNLFEVQELIYKTLPDDERFSEDQIIVNENDEVLGFNKKLLMGAANFSLKEIINIVHEHHGIAIASHIDREAFSLIAQLGFIPEDVHFDAFEIIDPSNADKYLGRDATYITSSDAHYLWEMGRRYTTFIMKDADFEELRRCLLKEGKRRVVV